MLKVNGFVFLILMASSAAMAQQESVRPIIPPLESDQARCDFLVKEKPFARASDQKSFVVAVDIDALGRGQAQVEKNFLKFNVEVSRNQAPFHFLNIEVPDPLGETRFPSTQSNLTLSVQISERFYQEATSTAWYPVFNANWSTLTESTDHWPKSLNIATRYQGLIQLSKCYYIKADN